MRSSASALILVGAAIAGCSNPHPTASQESTRAGPPAVLSKGPLTYFQSQCARCHGAYGSFYAQPFTCDTGAALTAKVDEMARGPGGEALAGSDLAAQAAFHRSMRNNDVFVCITGVQNGMVRGEVSPGAEVRVIGPGGGAAAEVEGHTWQCRLADVKGLWLVEARKGDRKAILDPRREAFSEVYRR